MRDDLPESYWEKQPQMKEMYDKAINDSGINWWRMYADELAKRKAIEAKYNALTEKIKDNAIRAVNGNSIEHYEGEFGKMHRVDLGNGIERNVQHIMKEAEITPAEKAHNLKLYHERLADMDLGDEKEGM